MMAAVPYLAALAGQQAPDQPRALRPPRRLFAENPTPPATVDPIAAEFRAPALMAPVQDDARAPASQPRPARAREVAEGREPVVSSGSSPTPAGQAEPAARLISEPVSYPGAPSRPENLPSPGPQPAYATETPAGSPPPAEPPSPAVEIAPDTRPPASWTDPRWGMAVELPETRSRKGTDATPPNLQPGPAAGRPKTERPVPDLDPAPGLASPTGPALGRDASRGRQHAREQPPAQVSIGTIEVIVVPPPQPPPEPPMTRTAPRPVSPLTAGLGADRMRDGLRRWHGIAQG